MIEILEKIVRFRLTIHELVNKSSRVNVEIFHTWISLFGKLWKKKDKVNNDYRIDCDRC